MFDLENFTYLRTIHPFEWVMTGIYTIVILCISFYIRQKNLKNPLYRFYLWGVTAKIFSAIVFCLIYIYYYNGGDTISYYETSRAMVNLGLKNQAGLLQVMTQAPSTENYFLFDNGTGYPWKYMYYDSQTFFVTKLLVPVLYVSFKSYLVSTIVLSWLSFFGIWRLFLMMCRYYPNLQRRIAWSILFVPSVLFWGSGILKDTITFTSVCWFIVALDGVMIEKRKRIRMILVLIVSTYVLLSIKAYILISLLPGAIVWVFYSRIARFRSKFLKIASIPLIYIFSFLLGYGVLSAFGDKLGKFSVEKMLKTASVTQKDLKQDYYHGSSFDIGDFDPTIGGVISKAPAAITVGLFRPFLWEARNVVMIISGLENSIILALALILLFRLIFETRRFFNVMLQNPLLIFMLSYAILFSLLVGLSTSNFGALVRFKIPFLPAFVCFLAILNYYLGPEGKLQERTQGLR